MPKLVALGWSGGYGPGHAAVVASLLVAARLHAGANPVRAAVVPAFATAALYPPVVLLAVATSAVAGRVWLHLEVRSFFGALAYGDLLAGLLTALAMTLVPLVWGFLAPRLFRARQMTLRGKLFVTWLFVAGVFLLQRIVLGS